MSDSQFPGETQYPGDTVADETDGVTSEGEATERADTDGMNESPDAMPDESPDATPNETPGVADDLKGIVLPHDPTLPDDA